MEFAALWSHVKENEKESLKCNSLKVQNSEKSNVAKILETKFQEKFEKIRERYVGVVKFCKFVSHRVPCSRKQKQM